MMRDRASPGAPLTSSSAPADESENAGGGGPGGPAPLPGWLRDLLEAAKRSLADLYGARLQSVYLFGSQARGQATSESDVDLAIVLDEVRNYAGEIDRTSELISSLALAHDVSISRVFVSRADWDRAEGPFLHQVRSHAIAA